MSSSRLPANSEILSEPLVLKEEDVVTEAAGDAPNVPTLRVMVLFTCTATGNSGNGVSSMIFMVLVFKLIDYDKSSLLLLKLVDTMEYPHQTFFN